MLTQEANQWLKKHLQKYLHSKFDKESISSHSIDSRRTFLTINNSSALIMINNSLLLTLDITPITLDKTNPNLRNE